MNKYLMMRVAALAATAAATAPPPAASNSAVIIEHNGSITYCDQIDLSWHGIYYADIHNWTPCGMSSLSRGMGIEGKTKGIGKNVVLSDSYEGDVSEGYTVEYQLALPVKSGKAFNAYYTTNGTTVTRYIAGCYTLGTPGEKHAGPSTIDALRQIIAKRN